MVGACGAPVGRSAYTAAAMAASQSERAIEVHSRQAAEFDARYERLAHDPYESCFAYSRMRLDALLARYISPHGQGLRLLDVGVGTGHHLAELRARGYDGAGVDGSTEMLERARAANPGADLRRADVSSLPFDDGGVRSRRLHRGAPLPRRPTTLHL